MASTEGRRRRRRRRRRMREKRKERTNTLARVERTSRFLDFNHQKLMSGLSSRIYFVFGSQKPWIFIIEMLSFNYRSSLDYELVRMYVSLFVPYND